MVAVIAAAVAASASAAQLGVVGERESNQVSFVNTATNKAVGGPVEAGKGPTSVAITPDGKYAYVTDVFGESVSVIETGLRRKVTTIEEVGLRPFGIAITPDGKYAYATLNGSEKVAVISTATNKVVKTITVGAAPTGIAIAPSGKFAYVANFLDNDVEVINTETMSVTGQPIEVGEGPMGIEFTPAGTAYVVDQSGKEVSAINTATRKVTPIPLPKSERPRGITIAPDGTEAFVVDPEAKLVSVIDTGTNKVSGEVEVEGEPQEVAFAANGKTVYVTENAPQQVQTINVESSKVAGSAIKLLGEFPTGIALTPDQSPVAAFTPPSSVTAGVPTPFDGSASTDADGSIVSYAWTFEDGRDATGVVAVHTFVLPGTYNAKLTVVDDEGCGGAQVFTGRTAYCSGSAESSVSHPVTVNAPVTETSAPVCKSNFGIGGLSHNRKNGTARLRVSLHTAGSLLLFGKKVHAITRKAKAAGSMLLTIHARVELNKQLKKIHHARVPVRITFTPSDGCGYKTVHRSLSLLRAAKHRH
ncbi:MAG TPA: PKD domain-containing protein [Solirubrobacterales bacterium]|nr:PKD domain-containing protein [Solirubrobacterales bacterium]